MPLLSEKNAVIIGLRVSNFSEFDAVDKMRTWKLFKNGLILSAENLIFFWKNLWTILDYLDTLRGIVLSRIVGSG